MTAPAGEIHPPAMEMHRRLVGAMHILMMAYQSATGLAHYLADQGATGAIYSSTDDAVSRWLSAQLDDLPVYIGLIDIRVDLDDLHYVHCPTPPWLEQFIREYDTMNYPYLVDTEGHHAQPAG